MAKNKVSSFFVALMLAIVSFFVIFLFFPGASDKFFGVSLKNGETDIKVIKETITEKVTEKVTDVLTENVNTRVTDDIKSLISGN